MYGGAEISCRCLVAKLEGRQHLKDLDIGGRIILKYILEKGDEVAWTAFVWFMTGKTGWLFWKL
jgi:hypothetical protein